MSGATTQSRGHTWPPHNFLRLRYCLAAANQTKGKAMVQDSGNVPTEEESKAIEEIQSIMFNSGDNSCQTAERFAVGVSLDRHSCDPLDVSESPEFLEVFRLSPVA
ncbi:hypothetical protein AAMO2058_001755700 [Amorphochlora amoebiformis]|uniref:Uncharacterized protein n=1 Tax=Amorphochlora amoebiformis TaxID=1561963 RepID=A0A7S0DS60_9EUKA|eukprot:1392240-Amorphochlora_amoeboformis.AAC.2